MTNAPDPTPDPTPSQHTAQPQPHRWRALALLGIAQLMLIVDVTVVAVALPEMGADLGLDRAGLTWVASIYALVFGGLMLLGGKAADIIGPRRVVLTGLTIFTLASLLAGFATSPELLLVGRALQGFGAAAMSPAALSIIARIFTGAELTRALGVWSALGGAGAAIGVLLGGALTAGPGWAWVFWINVPIGALLLLTLIRYVPPLPGAGGRLDVLGALLVTFATGSVVYALVSAGDHGWLGSQTLLGLLGGAVGYALFALRQRTARAPLIQQGMLRRAPITMGLGLIFVATALMISVFFLGSFTMQHLHGFDALSTGLSFLPAAVGTIIGANIAGRIVGRLGIRTLSVLGFVIAGLGMAAAAGVFSMTVLIAGLGVAGFGLGIVFVTAAASTFSAVAPEEAGVASGTLSTFHEFGAATGVSAVSSAAAVALIEPGFDAFAGGYWFAAAVAAVAAVLALVLLPGRPSLGEPAAA
jgi:EmrB/QacA subfamily drug resistance transporter